MLSPQPGIGLLETQLDGCSANICRPIRNRSQLENDFNEYLNAEKAFGISLHRSMLGEIGRGMYAEALTFYPQPEVGKQYSIEDIGFSLQPGLRSGFGSGRRRDRQPLSVEQKAVLPQGCARLTDRVPRLLS